MGKPSHALAEYTLMDLLQAEAALTRASNMVDLIKQALKQKEEATRVTPTTDEIEETFNNILSDIKHCLVGSRQADLRQHHGLITYEVTTDRENYQSPSKEGKPLVPSMKSMALAKAVENKLKQAKFIVTSRVEKYIGEHTEPNGVQIVFNISW